MNFARLRAAMADRGVGAVLISEAVNVRWLTGFTGSFGFILATDRDATFITDSRYALQAHQQVSGAEVVSFKTPATLVEVLGAQLERLHVEQLAFEPSVTYSQWESWREKHPGVEWESMGDLISQLRRVKSPQEVARIRAASQLGEAAMERAISMVQVGVTEFDIGLDVEFFFRRQGAEIGFEPIVASGPNSSRPHHRAGERAIQEGDFVTIDLGCLLDGYASDITRTVVVGAADERQAEVYHQVLKAQVAAVEALRPGANGRDIDELARQVLDEKGLAQYFGHSLGHGLGATVHDPGRLSITADEPIEVGQVWTIEPGVYIEGFGGVRIEDDVLVTDAGPEILTPSSKALQVV